MAKIRDFPYPIYDQNLRFSLPYIYDLFNLPPHQKFDTLYMTCYPISYQYGGKMDKIDTLFMTKTAEKPYPLGPHITMQPI